MPEINTLELIRQGSIHIVEVSQAPVRVAKVDQSTVIIQTPSVITVFEEMDEHGGVIKHIEAVDISQDTVSAATLVQGYTAHNRLGQPITGKASSSGLPAGGHAGDLLTKASDTEGDAEWVPPASEARENDIRPITASAVHTEIGNINALLATI